MLTIGLEESLPKLPGPVIPSKLWSPYRLPLVRFLTQYPVERQALGIWVGTGWLEARCMHRSCSDAALPAAPVVPAALLTS